MQYDSHTDTFVMDTAVKAYLLLNIITNVGMA